MARIRTLKPEIPQSESLSRVSRDARLTFMLLISQCDDYGRFIAHPRAVSSALFPYDEDAAGLISGWLDELEREDCIRRYTAGGNSYLFLPKWGEHQRIDNAGKGKYPPPPEATAAAPRGEAPEPETPLAEIRGEIPRDAEICRVSPLDQGREGTKEGKGETRPRDAAPPTLERSSDVIKVFNAIAERGNWKKVELITPKRRQLAMARLRDAGGLEPLKALIERASRSAFLRGERNGKGHENWRCDFNYLMKQDTFAQLIEGKFDDNTAPENPEAVRPNWRQLAPDQLTKAERALADAEVEKIRSGTVSRLTDLGTAA